MSRSSWCFVFQDNISFHRTSESLMSFSSRSTCNWCHSSSSFCWQPCRCPDIWDSGTIAFHSGNEVKNVSEHQLMIRQCTGHLPCCLRSIQASDPSWHIGRCATVKRGKSVFLIFPENFWQIPFSCQMQLAKWLKKGRTVTAELCLPSQQLDL